MDDIRQSATSNRLLSTLSAGDFALLQPHLQRRTMQLHQILVEAGEPIELVYFPESGIVSIVASEIGEIEVGVVGNEGCVGAAVLLDVDRSSVTGFGQTPGQGLTIPATALREAAARSRTLQRCLLRYVHAFWVQTAETAFANARCTVEQRLARCLLMYHDRTDGNELTVTHECLATMLGVRRPGVTVATHVLEGEGLIRAKRGRITILDRPKLESAAGGSYRAAVAAYERIVAPATRRGPLPTFAPLHVASI